MCWCPACPSPYKTLSLTSRGGYQTNGEGTKEIGRYQTNGEGVNKWGRVANEWGGYQTNEEGVEQMGEGTSRTGSVPNECNHKSYEIS